MVSHGYFPFFPSGVWGLHLMAEPSRTRLGKQDRTAGNSSRGTQSRDIHHWVGGWEFQKWPLWTPNDSCRGCALWQSLPGHALVNRIARRGTPPAGRKAVTFIIGRGDGNSKSGLYGRPMIHVGAAPYGRAFPAPPLRASSHGGSWKALPHGFAGSHSFPFGDLGHFGVV